MALYDISGKPSSTLPNWNESKTNGIFTTLLKELATVSSLELNNLTGSVNITDLSHNTDDTSENIDYEKLLEKENRYEAKALTPVTVYLVILMIMGVIGNSIVLYIYKFRFKRSTSRIFILCLATFDLVTCLLGMPYHIIDMLYPVMFVWDTTCKVLSFALSFTIIASIFTLDMIAIDRYRKICKPFKKQLSSMGSKIISWINIVLSILVAIPVVFVYGSADVETRVPNVTGKECYISDDYADSNFPLIYDGLMVLIFLSSICILVGLYSKVGLTVWKHRKFTESSNDSKRSGSSQSTPSTSVLQLNAVTDEAKHGTNRAHYRKDKEDGVVHVFHSNSSVTNPVNSPSPYQSTTNSVKDKGQSKKLRLMSELSSGDYESSMSDRGSARSQSSSRHFMTKKQKRTIKITFMLFVITLVFVVSFLPYLTIEIMNGVNAEFWDGMSISEIVFLNLLMRTYFINNMINPIIYWFLDHKFKEEVVRLFGDIRKCKRSTRLQTRSGSKDVHT